MLWENILHRTEAYYSSDRIPLWLIKKQNKPQANVPIGWINTLTSQKWGFFPLLCKHLRDHMVLPACDNQSEHTKCRNESAVPWPNSVCLTANKKGQIYKVKKECSNTIIYIYICPHGIRPKRRAWMAFYARDVRGKRKHKYRRRPASHRFTARKR